MSILYPSITFTVGWSPRKGLLQHILNICQDAINIYRTQLIDRNKNTITIISLRTNTYERASHVWRESHILASLAGRPISNIL